MDGKNILILTGSPRRNGNSDRMTDALRIWKVIVVKESITYEKVN